MDITRKPIRPGIVALEMTGRILMGPDCQLIEKEVEQALAQGDTRVIFDLTGVFQIDSAGVGKIVMCYTRLKKSGGDLRLAGVKGMLDGVFKMTQVHKVIGMFPTAADAAENF
ncbi:MAG TPA: STAS domain-containing protein [Candidatus Acidoferrales bacterium]|nr:STAS domain-containing protein [Candidatus Acidoferrales bacterium]